MDAKLSFIINEVKNIKSSIEKIESIIYNNTDVSLKENGKNNNPDVVFQKQKTDSDINPFEALQNLLGVEGTALSKVIKLKENDVEFNFEINEKTSAKKQSKATLIILTCNYYLFELTSITSGELNKKLKWLGIGSLSHLNESLETITEFVAKKGGGKGYDVKYEINSIGLKKGLEYLKEIIN